MAFRTAGQRDTFDHLIAGAPANKTLQAIDAADRLSFRRFIGLGVGDLPPDDTTLVRFRQRTRAGGLIGKARRELERQLDAKAVRIRAGSLKVVDATLVPAATRPPRGPEAKERSAEESTPAEAKSPEVQKDAGSRIRRRN